eukprot:4253486-Ditylum_brightwellii.AAC.1
MECVTDDIVQMEGELEENDFYGLIVPSVQLYSNVRMKWMYSIPAAVYYCHILERSDLKLNFEKQKK